MQGAVRFIEGRKRKRISRESRRERVEERKRGERKRGERKSGEKEWRRSWKEFPRVGKAIWE